MKKVQFLLIILLASVYVFAQSKGNTYNVAISFNSKCCGVPDAKPLFEEIVKFKKANKVKSISYDKIGPLGREGEYMLGFNLKELSKKQKDLFVTMLNKVVPTLKTIDAGESSGSAELKMNEKKIDVKDLGRATIIVEKI